MITKQKLREAIATQSAHIKLVQKVLIAYLVPDSVIDEKKAIQHLLDILDGPLQRNVDDLVEQALAAEPEQGEPDTKMCVSCKGGLIEIN